MPDRTALERFWRKVKKTDTCWLWIASVTNKGYGKFIFEGKLVGAHRFSYEIHKGMILPNMVIDHLCRTPACVNPDHLEQVRQRENLMRGKTISRMNAEKTHCPAGHPYDVENTIVSVNEKGDLGRHCRTCQRGIQGWQGGMPYGKRTHCKNGHE